jgi:rhamnose utilization protein RhaD (predicted bifunctional aldolase and dehydrogenase)
MKESRQKKINALIKLSHELGSEKRQMAILGEGNTSVRLTPETFLVKASGSSLATLRRQDVVECGAKNLLSLLNRNRVTDKEVDSALLGCRRNPKSKKPSVEALFHAFLLTLPGVNYVGHTHAIAVNQVLCSTRAREFARKRIVPDEVVCCGPASVFIPYTDPGLRLAQVVRKRTQAFMQRYRQTPRVILIESHGIITLGRSPEAVMAAMFMAEKVASIWIGASLLGGPKFLSQRTIDRIANRSDEHYRQRALKI